MDRSNEMVVDCKVTGSGHWGLTEIKVRLEKDEPWDPWATLIIFSNEGKMPSTKKMCGMTFGEAYQYAKNY